MIVFLIVIGLLFCLATAYAACVVSGKCAEDEYRQWIDEVMGKWD